MWLLSGHRGFHSDFVPGVRLYLLRRTLCARVARVDMSYVASACGGTVIVLVAWPCRDNG